MLDQTLLHRAGVGEGEGARARARWCTISFVRNGFKTVRALRVLMAMTYPNVVALYVVHMDLSGLKPLRRRHSRGWRIGSHGTGSLRGLPTCPTWCARGPCRQYRQDMLTVVKKGDDVNGRAGDGVRIPPHCPPHADNLKYQNVALLFFFLFFS